MNMKRRNAMQHRRSDSSLGRNNTQGDGRRSPTEGSHSQGYDPIRHTASPDRQQQQPYYEYYPPQAVAHRAYYEGSPHSSNTQSEFELYETPRLSRSSPFRQLILESAKRI